jgi:HEAT repeat protein
VDLAAWLNARPERPAPKLPFFVRDAHPETPPSGDDGKLDVHFDVLARFEPGLKEKKKAAQKALAALDARDRRLILRYLDSPNVLVLIEADRALRAAGDAAVPDLVEAVRACEAPAGLYSPRAVAHALRILGKIEGPRAKAGLVELVPHVITSRDAVIRRTALGLVGRVGPGNAALDDAVVDLLGSTDLRERAAAARAAGALGLAAAAPKLRALLDDPHFTVRFPAREALERLEKK